jgi:hypothetical protein
MTMLKLHPATKTVFTLAWVFALLHLALCVIIGRYLVNRTETTVQHIVNSHRDEIATRLRINIIEPTTDGEDNEAAVLHHLIDDDI